MLRTNSEPLRVLHVLSGDLWAGAEVMAHTLLCELHHNSSIEPHAVVLNDAELAQNLRTESVKTTVLDETRNHSWQILAALNDLCASWEPDIVHTHRKKENVLGALAARRHRIPSVRTVHGWSEFPDADLSPANRLSQAVDTWIGRNLQDRIIAVSSDLKQKLTAVFKAGKLTVIENGVNIAAVRSQAAEPAVLPGHKDSLRVGIIGRLVPVKRHDLFIAAATKLLEQDDLAIDFYLAGDGPQREAIENAISASRHARNFHILGFRRDIVQVMASLDVVLVCSDHEGIPMNVLEAAAIGVPVASRPLPSIAAILSSGAKGTVATDSSADALATALRLALLGDKQPDPCLDEHWQYSSTHSASKYADLYREILSPKS